MGKIAGPRNRGKNASPIKQNGKSHGKVIRGPFYFSHNLRSNEIEVQRAEETRVIEKRRGEEFSFLIVKASKLRYQRNIICISNRSTF